jgi:iron complex outermembrane recepter protein
MKLMKFTLNVLILLLTVPLLSAQNGPVQGVVIDKSTGDFITGAHVYFEGLHHGSFTDENGTFHLTSDDQHFHIIISHVGYETIKYDLSVDGFNDDLTIYMEPVKSSLQDDIIITSGRIHPALSGVYSGDRTRPVEDHLRNITGLDLVNRANFARDPVIRGLRDGRVDIMIDGMRMTPACVDGMDPLTAYIETDNLESIEIGRGQSGQGPAMNSSGGSMNFQMARATPETGLRGSLEAGYHSVSSQQIYQGMMNYGGNDWGIRISGTYRNSGDMFAGKGNRVSNSSLEKGNVHASLLYQPDELHRFDFQYIGDFAGKIGYPALIMDTRRADAHILGLEHTWDHPIRNVTSLNTKLYMNSVQHWMDDYARDVTSREVMRNMYMPMYGETLTYGLNSSGSYVNTNHLIEFRVESYRIDANADMWMYHVNPEVSDMYLVNLGDVSNWNSSISAKYTHFSGSGWNTGADLRVESGVNRIRESSAVNIYRSEYPDLKNPDSEVFVYLIGLHAEKEISGPLTAGFRLSDGTRLPDHLQRYGYYIYQPLDGFFYIGNPGLEPERSSQAEIYMVFGSPSSIVQGSSSLWVNRMDRYIAGTRYDSIFKRYDNMGVAVLWGIENEISIQPYHGWNISAGASYIIGHHNKLDEPLPMIPPLKGTVSLLRTGDWMDVEASVNWAASQNRIASVNSLEYRTPGYIVANLFSRFKISETLRLQTGIENLLNHYYADHLSVNSMPAPGRNIHLSLRVSL